MTEIEFAKYHGSGNDFVLIEDMRSSVNLTTDQIAGMCERHTGIGADGVMFIRPSDTADLKMTYHNADGTEAEMCGNGIRCFAKYAHDYRLVRQEVLAVETRAGVRRVELVVEDGVAVAARVDMGVPKLSPAEVPVRTGEGEAVDVALPSSHGDVYATCVSMGNPHCVVFGPDVSQAPVRSLGWELERASMFPEGVNVEFVEVMDRGHLRARVWERGVGETMACGTGACAAAVAAARTGKTDRQVEVELPGGTLTVDWTDSGTVMLTGPATQVMTGMYFLQD